MANDLEANKAAVRDFFDLAFVQRTHRLDNGKNVEHREVTQEVPEASVNSNTMS